MPPQSPTSPFLVLTIVTPRRFLFFTMGIPPQGFQRAIVVQQRVLLCARLPEFLKSLKPLTKMRTFGPDVLQTDQFGHLWAYGCL